MARNLCRRWMSLGVVCALLAGTTTLLQVDTPEWPLPLAHADSAPQRDADSAPQRDADSALQRDADDALVRSQPVCVLSTRHSAGDIGRSLVVRHRRDGDRLWVSYFVYWSSERPWGDKPWLLSLAIDAFYSHFMFVLPGLRHALYGPGDIEGVTVVYRTVGERLEIVEGFGDDEYHRRVHLGPSDLTGDDNCTVLLTTSWSHQLGGRGGASLGSESSASRRCFAGSEFVPLTTEIANRFWLGSPSTPRRARYAWL